MVEDAEVRQLRQRVAALETQRTQQATARGVGGFYPPMAILTVILSATTLYAPGTDGTVTYTYGTVWQTPLAIFWIILAALLAFSVFEPTAMWAPIVSAVIGFGIALGVGSGVGARTSWPELTVAGSAAVGLGACVAVVCAVHAVRLGIASRPDGATGTDSAVA